MLPVRVRAVLRKRVSGLSSNGLGMAIELPITMISAIVSPRARPIPRITAATMPERAAGNITWRMVCQCVAPRASEPSLYALGTAWMASRAMLVTVGRIMIARMIEAFSRPKPVFPSIGIFRIRGANTTIPNRP